MTKPILPPLPRPPQARGGKLDPHELERWYTQIWKALGNVATISWDMISKAGSKLSDLETRPHSQLQVIDGWVSGTAITQTNHISQADGKVWQDHVLVISGNPHGTDHSQLSGVLGADTTSSASAKTKHVSNLQAKTWQDHVNEEYQALIWM